MQKRTDKEILSDMQRVECALSPENLHCDGEISHSAAAAKGRKLKAQWKELVKELGREPSAKELYE